MSADNNNQQKHVEDFLGGAEQKRAVTSHGRIETPQRDGGQTLLIILVILALAASIIMLFTGSVGAMKIALLAALWAAVIGVFLAFRYRNQIESTRSELEAQREQHSIEMKEAEARLHAGRAELERDITKRVTEELRTEESETLATIREQLEQLQNQLEFLTGQTYVEPGMLHAEARRIQEIEAEPAKESPTQEQEEVTPEPVIEETKEPEKTPEPEPTPAPEPVPADTHEEEEQAPVFGASKKPEKGYATPEDTFKKTAEKVSSKHTDHSEVEDTKQFSRIDIDDAPTQKKQTPQPSTFDTGSFTKVDWVQGGTSGKRSTGEQKPEGSSTYIGKRSAEAQAANTRHGKRRRDEHGQALSVADLIKRNNKDA